MAGQQPWPQARQGWGLTSSDGGPVSGAWSLETISPYGEPLPAPSWPPPPGTDTGWTAEMYQTGPLRTVEAPPSRPGAALPPAPTGPLTGPITAPTRLLNRVAPAPAPVKVRQPWLRTPLLLRGTIAVAVAAAVLASVARTRLEENSLSNDVLRVTNARQSSAATPPVSARPKQAAPAGQRKPAAGAPLNKPAGKIVATDVAQPGAACQVDYAVTPQAKSQYAVTVTLTNSGTTQVDGWSLRWQVPSKQRITFGWNAAVSTSGTAATASDGGFERTIPANGRVTFGFITGPANPVPPASGFALNGVTCS